MKIQNLSRAQNINFRAVITLNPEQDNSKHSIGRYHIFDSIYQMKHESSRTKKIYDALVLGYPKVELLESSDTRPDLILIDDAESKDASFYTALKEKYNRNKLSNKTDKEIETILPKEEIKKIDKQIKQQIKEAQDKHNRLNRALRKDPSLARNLPPMTMGGTSLPPTRSELLRKAVSNYFASSLFSEKTKLYNTLFEKVKFMSVAEIFDNMKNFCKNI